MAAYENLIRTRSSALGSHRYVGRRQQAALSRNGPNRQFRAVRGPYLPEDPIQIFLNRAFSEMQLVGNFLVELCLTNQIYHLSLTEAQRGTKRFLDVLGGGAARTNSFAALATEFTSASKAVSQLPEFNNGRHEI